MLKDRLKEARLMRNMTQQDLAEKSGVQKASISNYEVGRTEPDMYRLGKLMEALDVDANYLLQDEMRIAESRQHVLTDDESALVNAYRLLDTHGQRMLRLVADEELARIEEKPLTRAEELQRIGQEIISEHQTPEASQRA